MAKFQNGVLYNNKTQLFYCYLDEIFMVFPHCERTLGASFGVLNEHEPRIRFKATVNK